MKKSRKVLLISSLGLLSTAAVVVPTTAVLTQSQTTNNQSNSSFFNTYSNTVNSTTFANSNTGGINIKDLINLLKKIKELIDKFKKEIEEKLGHLTISQHNGGVDVTLDINSTSILKNLTVEKIKEIDIDKFLRLAQTVLIQMNIIAPNSPRFLTFKSLSHNKEETSAVYELIVNWPNTTNQKPYILKVTLNNLYPPQLYSETSIASDKTQDGNALPWMLGGILGGIGAIVLVAVLIYILFRKTRWEIENNR